MRQVGERSGQKLNETGGWITTYNYGFIRDWNCIRILFYFTIMGFKPIFDFVGFV